MNKNRSATVQQNILYLKAIGRQMLTQRTLLRPCSGRLLLTAYINTSGRPVTSATTGSTSSSRISRRSQKGLRADQALLPPSLQLPGPVAPPGRPSSPAFPSPPCPSPWTFHLPLPRPALVSQRTFGHFAPPSP